MTSIHLLLPKDEFRLWHEKLYQALRAAGFEVFVSWRPKPVRGSGIALLEELERLLLARHQAQSLQIIEVGPKILPATGPCDLTFDLSGADTPAPDAIFPCFGGMIGDQACDAMLLDSAPAQIDLMRQEQGQMLVIASAHIAVEQPNCYRAGREAVARRLSTLIRSVVTCGAQGQKPAHLRTLPPASVGRFLLASLAGRVKSRLNRLVAHENHWRIGWRKLQTPESKVHWSLAWPQSDWFWLSDDKRRYYADPFLFKVDGVTHVFCEEYPYDTGKGVISWFALDAQGRAEQKPQVIIEQSYHLSYPQVFRYNDTLWMLPESSAAQRLDLYRAVAFPQQWVREACLLDNVDLADATIFQNGGCWWILATSREDGGSSWDCLLLFHAPSLLGPWQACPKNPVLIDVATARPAGEVFYHNGALWRPAQDCSGGYGSALTLCRVDRLEESGFAQTLMGRMTSPDPTATCIHTLNSSTDYEIIDVAGPRSKLI